MKPTNLNDAVALFASDESLQSVYGFPFEPGVQQRNLVAITLKNIASGARLSLFPGAAGTGKTTTLKVLLAVLKDCNVSYSVAAPTWKAAGRASEALDGESVTTIHSIIYAGAREEHEIDEETGLVKEFEDELVFNKRDDGTAAVGSVLVIDESSMVGAIVAADLWAAIPPSTMVVAVGDPHQLPPVEDGAGFPLKDAAVELTEVYRQADGSPVLKAATRIRQDKVPFTYSKVADWKAGEAILKASGVPSKWMDSNEAGVTLAAMFRRADGDAVAIVGTHKTRVVLNDAVRVQLGFSPRNKGPRPGERLVCRASGAGLHNADVVTVVESELVNFGSEFGDGWVLRVNVGGGKERECAVLRKTWENVYEPKNRGQIPYSVRKGMDELIEADEAKHGEAIALAVAAREADYVEKHGGEELPGWLKAIWVAQEARKVGAYALYLKKYLASLDSGYAITCHMAQGSQYKEILVVADMVDFIADGDKDNVYRWSYTALTRAVENALVVKKSKDGWGK